MKEYEVKFIKIHTYRIKANSLDKAIDMAYELVPIYFKRSTKSISFTRC